MRAGRAIRGSNSTVCWLWLDSPHSRTVDDYEEFEPASDAYEEQVQDALRELFNDEPQSVFYGRQLVVRFEAKYFHWVTNRALRHLAASGEVTSKAGKLWPDQDVAVKFYFSKKCRYWRRDAARMIRLIQRYSSEAFGHALGNQGEMMFDAALGARGFRVLGRNVNEFAGKKWAGTGENLDRLYERDGVVYGCEIKNTLDYIPHEELESKLDACESLGVRPLFIMRMAPKTYMKEIIDAGGYGLLFADQLYPFGWAEFAQEVRNTLRLPVACPTAVPAGLIDKFEVWHGRG